MNDDMFGLFQVASPMRSDPPGTFWTEDGKKGRASYLPSDIRIAVDPAVPDGAMIVIDEASGLFADVARRSRKTGVTYTDWAYRQFPSLKRFIEQYSTFVPQDNNNPKEKYTMDMSGIARMREDLENMLKTFAGMVAVVERFGGEPGDGTVIKFEHTFEADLLRNEEAKVYDYVAVRKFGKWYVSGRPFSGKAVKWAELLEFIGEGRAWVCSEFTEVPVPGASASSADQDKAAAVAELLANASGRDTAEVAAEVVALLRESK
ncbi:hypothetical protein [Actinophytocola sp.]|uniref:hypothetical protein n=1 Tax=Actinophytocola sp. TaxID=1872138 RepID=UPI002D7F3522|nr:hypothetical protein [Actinophytocola sp.]HET9144119.1 hypothetical protein [Actinophytocola sp.]